MRHNWSEEQYEFIKNNALGISDRELTKLFNKEFNLNLGERKIEGAKARRGIKSGLNNQFKKGCDPWNKGKKGYMGANKTSFKKGEFSPKRVEISSERITKAGYIQIKIKDGEKQQNWRGKHILDWEKVNGALPPGHIIIFGDGDNRNFDIDNLICVSRKQLLGLNRDNLIQNDANLTRTAVIIIDLNQKISEISKGGLI